MTPPVTLCIVNYNGERYLPRTLEAVRGSSLAFDEILLVDDASPDRSVALVRESWPEVTVLARATNGGPGAARNAGYAAARNDLILFIDNDVALTPGCAERLRTALLEREEAAVAMLGRYPATRSPATTPSAASAAATRATRARSSR